MSPRRLERTRTDRIRRHLPNTHGIDFYGYGEPIVKAFQAKYGIDIRVAKEFDKAAWHDLKGEAMVQIYRDLAALCRPRNKELWIGLQLGRHTQFSVDPHFSTHVVARYSNHWRTLVDERVADAPVQQLRGGTATQTGARRQGGEMPEVWLRVDRPGDARADHARRQPATGGAPSGARESIQPRGRSATGEAVSVVRGPAFAERHALCRLRLQSEDGPASAGRGHRIHDAPPVQRVRRHGPAGPTHLPEVRDFCARHGGR